MSKRRLMIQLPFCFILASKQEKEVTTVWSKKSTH